MRPGVLLSIAVAGKLYTTVSSIWMDVRDSSCVAPERTIVWPTLVKAAVEDFAVIWFDVGMVRPAPPSGSEWIGSGGGLGGDEGGGGGEGGAVYDPGEKGTNLTLSTHTGPVPVFVTFRDTDVRFETNICVEYAVIVRPYAAETVMGLSLEPSTTTLISESTPI